MSLFKLPREFVDKYINITPPFGFDGLGEIVYKRTYSRVKDDDINESWYETVERVVNGTFSLQLRKSQYVDPEAQMREAKVMYDKIFNMKFLPPGRGLWAMGTVLTEEKELYGALYNCAMVSTADLDQDPLRPFEFLFDSSMLGVGVGFDTRGAGKFPITKPGEPKTYVIPDSREGWVKSLTILLSAYFKGTYLPIFDYSQLRPQGQKIKGFGGTSAGPSVLRELHTSVKCKLDPCIGKPISITNIADIFNLVGKCVQSANVRGAAEIAFGDPNSEEYINLKNYKKHPERAGYGWSSNNSVFAELGMDYTKTTDLIKNNGEPGYAWLHNMRSYSRMNGIIDNKDIKAVGANPCNEQTLESFEMCCLVETFPHRHESLEEYLDTLYYAFLYAKTVTMGMTTFPETNEVMTRNRRVGCSMSGIAQFITARGRGELIEWCKAGYDHIQNCDAKFSERFGIARSIKTTSIKPSGTVSLLAGATPGVHYPISRYYIRRVRMQKTCRLLPDLRKAGYKIEPTFGAEKTSVVVEFIIDCGKGVRKLKDVSIWEQLENAALLQQYWADNQVSCTVTFQKHEASQLKPALDIYQYRLKGISFLPEFDGQYAQMPYEAITEAEYIERASQIKTISIGDTGLDPTEERFCTSDKCIIRKRQVQMAMDEEL